MTMKPGAAQTHAEQLAAGFSAVVFTCLLANTTIESRSDYLTYSLWLLSVALPAMTAWWTIFHEAEDRKQTWADVTLAFVGYIGGYLGMVLLVLNTSVVAAGILLAATAAALAALFWGSKENQ